MLRYAWVLLLLAPAASAKYAPLWFADRVLRADVIAVGRVEKLAGGSYWLRVERALTGCKDGELLKVRRFVNWTCARRQRLYRKGERIVAILGRFPDGLAPLGSACEGEVLLSKEGARVIHPPGPDVVFERDVIQAITELRGGFELKRLLRSKSVLVLQATVEKLYFGSFDKEGLAAEEADAFARLLTHDDASLRMDTAKGLARMVGADRAATLVRGLAKKEKRGGARLAIAIALCYARPKDVAAYDLLLEVLARYEPASKEEMFGIQHLLYDAQQLGPAVGELYPRVRRLLARDLKRELEHPLLIALRRWHGEKEPLPYAAMAKERQRWLDRTR